VDEIRRWKQINPDVIRGFSLPERSQQTQSGNALPKAIEEISIRRIDALDFSWQ